jgi:hypothetical protein
MAAWAREACVKLALLAAGLAAVLDASPSAADTYPRQPGVNALHMSSG